MRLGVNASITAEAYTAGASHEDVRLPAEPWNAARREILPSVLWRQARIELRCTIPPSVNGQMYDAAKRMCTYQVVEECVSASTCSFPRCLRKEYF